MLKFEDVGQLLCAARCKFGLTQEQFAVALGVKLSRLQKWESGANEPRFTIPELRRLRNLNPEVFDALISGFLLVHPPFSPMLYELLARTRRSQAGEQENERQS